MPHRRRARAFIAIHRDHDRGQGGQANHPPGRERIQGTARPQLPRATALPNIRADQCRRERGNPPPHRRPRIRRSAFRLHSPRTRNPRPRHGENAECVIVGWRRCYVNLVKEFLGSGGAARFSLKNPLGMPVSPYGLWKNCARYPGPALGFRVGIIQVIESP